MLATELSDSELPVAERDRLGQRVIVGGRFDVRAALEQRQGAAADEVDLEAEQDVVGAGRRDQRVRIGADAEQRADEAADVRRHGDDDVAARDAVSDSGTSRYCAHCAHNSGSVGLHLVDKALVELAQPRRLMQVGEREAGDAERGIRC